MTLCALRPDDPTPPPTTEEQGPLYRIGQCLETGDVYYGLIKELLIKGGYGALAFFTHGFTGTSMLCEYSRYVRCVSRVSLHC